MSPREILEVEFNKGVWLRPLTRSQHLSQSRPSKGPQGSGYTPDVMRSNSPWRSNSRPLISKENDLHHITSYSRRVEPSRLRRIMWDEEGRLSRLAERSHPFPVSNEGGDRTERIAFPRRHGLQEDRGNRLTILQPVVLFGNIGEVITDLENKGVVTYNYNFVL